MLAQFTNILPMNLMGTSNQKVLQYTNFLKSRTILDGIDSLYHLQEDYNIKYRKFFYKALRNNIQIIDNEDNTITLNFLYKEDAEKAANIANSFYDLLYAFTVKLNTEKYRKLHEFLERSYNLTMKRIAIAEDKLTNYQVKNHIYDVETQAEGLIKAIAELQMEKIKTEVELNYFKNNLSKTDPNLRSLKTKITVLDQKISNLENGKSNGVQISLKKIPQKAAGFLRLYRDVEILNKVLEFLVPQLEQARLQEVKKSADIQILERAVPDDYKTKPKRIAIIFTISFIYFIISILVMILYDYYKKNKSKIDSIIG
jgi:capsule polysaccharide export protein KpsE/RkpR